MQNIRPYALTSQRSLALLIALGLHLLLLQLLNGKACRREVEPAPTFTSLMLLAAPALAPAPLAATPRPARAGGARQITLAAPAAEPSPDQASAADLSAALEQDRPHHSSTTLKLDLKDAVAMIATAERRRRAQPPLEQWGKFEKGAEFARAAECGKDTFKHDPPPTIAGFQLGGLLLLPFAAKTILTGKCKF